jgi:acyl phosphate:glycerol-3-phosphate acyltransferase
MTPALLSALLALLLAYLLGSLVGSLLLGRAQGVDVRTLGSGNAGGTNALRTRGWRFALGVVVIDVGKGALAAWLALLLHRGGPPDAGTLALAATLAAAAGHVWPLWAGFRGGKGVATLFGGLLLAWPLALPLAVLTWLLVLGLSGYVGLASVLAVAALVPQAAAFGTPVQLGFAVAAALFVLYTHRANLARLAAGREHRFDRARLLWRLFLRR